MQATMKLLWLAVFILCLSALSQGDPLYIMSAPNVLRVGSKENIFLEAQEYNGGNINVEIVAKDFPAKIREYFSKTVTLTSDNKFQVLQEIEIKEDAFDRDSNKKQYVYIQAKFPQHILEKVVLLSFQAGYIFVQTDKTIYTPTSTVRYRVFTLNPAMEPVENGISVEIMTPDGITIHRDQVFPANGVKTGVYELPEIVSTGTWKMVGKFQKTPQINFTADFEVKEYVLPTFEVKLEPRQTFFHVDDSDLVVDITAKFLYGKEVTGKAFVVFGLVTPNGEKQSFPGSLQRVEIKQGNGIATLERKHITDISPNIQQLVGSSIYMTVTVLTSTGTDMVEAEKKGILIVTSPYSIHFGKTPRFYKPGMPFDIAIYVTNPDNTPAANIKMKVTPGPVYGTTKNNGMARLTVNTIGGNNKMDIEVETEQLGLQNNQQAKNKMTVQAYKTHQNSQNYLHIGIQATELEIGDNMLVNLNLKNNPNVQDQINHFTILVINKGQIVLAKRHERAKGQSLVTTALQITKDMVPSFRFVAYYHLGSAEIVSDSVWVDVKDTCMGKLKITSKRSEYQPRNRFSLTIEGDPGAKVGLVAVDKGVYVLNSKNRLSQSKIWDIVENHDIGCTAGSGNNNMDVFYDAGLIFQSSAKVETKSRTEHGCPAPPKRRRRSLTLVDFKMSLVSKYTTQLQKQCCSDGMLENLMGYTCERRSEYIVEGQECVDAFLHCCNEMTKNVKKTAEEQMLLARSEDDDSYISDRDIVSRTQFPESWLWQEEVLPNCPRPGCTTTTKEISNYLKDSITTWEVTAISLSSTHGICVADPFEMRVVKDFFIDLKLPYSAVRNEQLEIKAVLYNSMDTELKVRVELMETETVCSAASKKRKHREETMVPPLSSTAVAFVIIPMALGRHSIEVKASVFDTTYSDGVKKDLLVVPEGVQIRKEVTTVILNPSLHGGQQVEKVKGTDLKHRVPGSPAETFISVTGDQLGQTIQTVISGSPLGNLIQQPSGCGEQNMIGMTGPVIATYYLDNTGQWEKVGVDKRETAIKYIRTGYTQQLTYRNDKGAYHAWKNQPGSTWLTAYVLKVFAMAYRLISIEEDVICSAAKWLVLNKQLPDGVFKEDSPVYHGEMVGNVRGKDADASLTAFVLIAMQEANPICGVDKVSSLPDSIKKAKEFLTRRLHSLTNSYAVAMTSYALANDGKHHLDTLFKFASDDKSHWPVVGGHFFTLEATAYALLALVKARDFDRAAPVVQWLTQQQFYGGGHGSTQATIIVFQAVAQYYMDVDSLKDIDLQVDISVAGRSKDIGYTFNKNNAFLTRSLKVNFDQELNVTATGVGQGTVSVMTLYNALPAEAKAECKTFSLQVELKKTATKGDYLETYKLEIDMTYRSNDRDATMSVLDITLLTGFSVDQDDLRMLTTGKDRYVQKFEMDKQLSAKGSLILYLDKVSRSRPDRVVFRVHREQLVGVLQPAAVTVYEYYSNEHRCTRFYHPEKKDGALNRICKDDMCRCAEENCSLQMKLGKENVDRVAEACTAGMDYAYKVKVVHADLSPAIDYYTILVTEVIKEGTDTGVQGKERQFISHPYCRESIDLLQDKTYLLMGRSHDVIKGEDNSRVYMVGGGTWIEYWPTEQECQEAKHRDTCLGLTSASMDLLTFGCPT